MDDIEVMARGVAKQRAVRMAEACGVDPSRITDFTIDARDREDAQAAHAALEAAGRVVVPKEPTEAMVQAAWRYQPKHPNPSEAYRAMIEEASNAGK